MSKKELAKRYLVFILGLFFAGVGVAFTKHGNLGVSPISSVANVMSIRLPALSMGNWLIIWNCVLIAAQVAVLRKNFKIYQLLQIPLSFLFGYFTDFGMWLAGAIPVPNYLMQLVMLALGIGIISFGISLSVIANVIMNSCEALVKAISDQWKLEFGYTKVAFDVFCVVAALILSLLFFGRVVGTREGTVISALCTGFVIKAISGRIRPLVMRFING